MSKSVVLEMSKEYTVCKFSWFQVTMKVSPSFLFFKKLFPKCLQGRNHRSMYTVFEKTLIVSILCLGYKDGHINLNVC